MSKPCKDSTDLPCPVCGSFHRVLVYGGTLSAEGCSNCSDYTDNMTKEGHYPIVRCTACGIHYAFPRDSRGTLERMYRNGPAVSYMRESRGRLRKFRREARWMRDVYGAKGNLLEVGCATGLFLKAAAEVGFRVEGCDPWVDASRIATGQFGDRIRNAPFRVDDYQSASYDAVVMWGVLEHVWEPVQLIQDCNKLLAHGGCLAISSPDVSSLSRRILRGRWQFFERAHLTYFDPDTISNLLRRAGFGDIVIRGNRNIYSLSYLAEYTAKWNPKFSRLLKSAVQRIFQDQGPIIKLPSGGMRVYAKKRNRSPESCY